MTLVHVSAVLLISVSAAEAQPARQALTVWVGAATRDGYLETDRGVQDSIKDLVSALRKDRTLRVVTERQEDAALLLIVEGRVSQPDGGTVSVPIGATRVDAPIDRRIVRTTLRTPNGFERPISSSGETWRKAADAVAKDARAWIAANRERLGQ